MSHGSAPLTVQWSSLIVEPYQAGWKQTHIAAVMGASLKCVKIWVDRYALKGEAGLVNRSSRPHLMPSKTSPESAHRVLAAAPSIAMGRARSV